MSSKISLFNFANNDTIYNKYIEDLKKYYILKNKYNKIKETFKNKLLNSNDSLEVKKNGSHNLQLVDQKKDAIFNVSKSIKNSNCVELFTSLNFHSFLRCFNGPSRLVTIMVSFSL